MTRHIRPLRRGYVHRRDLIDAGWRPDAVRAAVSAENLVRAGRQWILVPEADAALHAAAAHNAVVTCVTAATVAKLWVREPSAIPHLAMPPGARRNPPNAHAHWAAPVVPREPRLLTDPILNILAAVATCLPHEDALMIWESALRQRRVSVEDLFTTSWPSGPARRMRDEATAKSHSGLETRFAIRMRRLGVDVRQQVELAGHRVDALVGRRIVVQIDGFAHHSDAAQRRSDIAHDRALARLGYHVLRFDYHEVMHEWARVEAAVLRALAREPR